MSSFQIYDSYGKTPMGNKLEKIPSQAFDFLVLKSSLFNMKVHSFDAGTLTVNQ